jgi:hypothetical protein
MMPLLPARQSASRVSPHLRLEPARVRVAESATRTRVHGVGGDAMSVSKVISEVAPLTSAPDAFAWLSEGRDGLNKILVSPDA